MSKPELVSAAITQAGTFVLPPQAAAITTDDTGTVYADGRALTPVHCPGCNCRYSTPVWRRRCRWCGREYDQTRDSQNYDWDCCSEPCRRDFGKERAKREAAERDATLAARRSAGARTCSSRTRAGQPCLGVPLLTTDVCFHHADEAQKEARKRGKAWGLMAVTDDLAHQMSAGLECATITDAYRRVVIATEIAKREKALAIAQGSTFPEGAVLEAWERAVRAVTGAPAQYRTNF